MARTPVLPQKITEILDQSHTLTAPQLVAALQAAGQKCNKTSVYRALERMLEAGTLCRQSFGTADTFYELRAHHHDHVVCESCHKVESIPCHNHHTQEIIGFSQLGHHHCVLFGVCDSCGVKK